MYSGFVKCYKVHIDQGPSELLSENELFVCLPFHTDSLRLLLLSRHQLLDSWRISVLVPGIQSNKATCGDESGRRAEACLVLRCVLFRPDVRSVHGGEIA